MISGFEQEMLGAEIGEKREFTLTPEKAYGMRDEAAIQKVPKSQFPDDMQLARDGLRRRATVDQFSSLCLRMQMRSRLTSTIDGWTPSI